MRIFYQHLPASLGEARPSNGLYCVLPHNLHIPALPVRSTGWTQKVSLWLLFDVSAMRAYLCVYPAPVKLQYIHFPTKFDCNKSENDKIMLSQPRQPHIWAFERHAAKSERVHSTSCLQTLQNWTHWTATSEAPCWKSIMNSSRRLRRMISWKLPCRPSEKSFHKNTSTGWWPTPPSAWLRTWLRMVVTPSICCNCLSPSLHAHHFYSQQTDSFQSHQRTAN